MSLPDPTAKYRGALEDNPDLLAAAELTSGERKKSQASELVDLALAQSGIEFFHSPAMQPFAMIPVGTHRETWTLKSAGFRTWLSRLSYSTTGKAPSTQALQAARDTLIGKALFDGPEFPVFVRVAERGGSIYLDLGDTEWRAADINKHGWRVVTNPSVRFRRTRGMLPLPEPIPGGSVQELFRFVNIQQRSDQILFLAWLVYAFCPLGPYPILALHGGQGSAKTTSGTVARKLIDPNAASLRTIPRDERDLMIAASNGHVIGFDNLSWVPSWLSDAMCRLATGGGLSTRELYTDEDEVIFSGRRPIVVNGIEELAARGDLLDRMVILHLPPISDAERRDEKNFWAEFERVRSRILGALLAAVSVALRNVEKIQLPLLPRMADFALWATATEGALGFQRGDFIRAYTANRAEANRVALESSPAGLEIISFLDSCRGVWEGTAGELLKELAERVEEQARKERHWPKTPKAMRDALDRVAPNLAAVGVSITALPRQGRAGRRVFRLEKKAQTPSETSAPSAGQSSQSVAADSHADGQPANGGQPSASNSNSSNTSEGADSADGEFPISKEEGEF